MNSYSIICPYFLKKRILSSLDPTDRVKFYSIEDSESFLLPKISLKALEYVYFKYADKNLSYALTLVNSLKYLKDEYHYDKTELLFDIRKDLKENNLVEFDRLSLKIFKKYPSKIIGYSNFNNFRNLLRDKEVEFTEVDDEKYIDLSEKVVYSFKNKREEYIETVNLVGSLLESGVNFDDIAVVCSEQNMPFLYMVGKKSNVLFSYENINLKIDLFADRCLKMIEKEETDELIKLLKSSSTDRENIVKSKILEMYNSLKESELKKDFFLEYFKRSIKNTKVCSLTGIKLVSDIEKVANVKHVFLLDFDESYPTTHKDDDFLFDKIKKEDTFIEQSVDVNQAEKNKLAMILSNIEDIRIFLSENDEISGEIFPSSMIEDFNMRLEDYPYNSGDRFTYSFDQLDYSIMNSNYLDYGVCSSYYLLLEDIFKESYVKYSPNDTRITCEFDTSKLRFSYSSMTTYAKCPFRYLIEKVYRINDSQSNQSILDIGTFCHYYLEKFVNGEKIDFQENFKVLNKSYDSLSVQDKFYLHKAYREIEDFASYLSEFLDAIGSSKDFYTEKKFEFKLQNKYEITGIIDLIVEDVQGFLIFDYKTGNHSLSEDDVVNGFDMQLPFYTYVASEKFFPHKKPVGMFYITMLQPNSISDYYDSFKFKGINLDSKEFYGRVSDFNIVKKYIPTGSKAKLKYEDLNRMMMEKIDQIISGVKSFNFPVTKKVYVNSDGSWGGNQCEYCNYRDVCFVDDNSKQVVEITKLSDRKTEEKN